MGTNDDGASWRFSSNAEPTYNLRFVSTRPHPFPFFSTLGTYRFDIVLGKLSGHSYPARPWFNGQKMAFNFGDNLEISFTRWSIFWGVGHPITLHSFKENIFSFNSTGSYVGNGTAFYGDRNDPGDRKSNFDFRYKLPFVRRSITLYADAYSDDDPSPHCRATSRCLEPRYLLRAVAVPPTHGSSRRGSQFHRSRRQTSAVYISS